ncbi:MAG TPA: transposase [Acidimicrobiales bacterium]|nr:transposase [Acidimicrobiales bacterium]
MLEVSEGDDEVVVTIETTLELVGCGGCGTRAEAQGRMAIDIRDLACFGRPARLRWIKRRWRCVDADCDARTWTERSTHVDAQAVLTRRAGAEACRQVGEEARAVSRVAAELGVCWWTVMNAVIEHGTPLVDDPDRVGPVRQLGVDETTYLSATRSHSTIYATALVDLEARVLIDMVEGNAAADLRRWTEGADGRWLGGIEVVATDLAESFRAGLSPHLDHATRVADPFHVVRVGNRCVDKVRRRVQNETLGHRGRKDEPLYRIRKLLLAGDERLDERGRNRLLLGLRVGDPHDEVLGAWLAKESVRDVYSPTIPPWPPRCSTRPSPAVAPTTSRRSAPSATPSPRGAPRSSLTTTRAPPTDPPRGSTSASSASSAAATVQAIRALPAPSAAACRRRHLARPTSSAAYPNPRSALKRVPPLFVGLGVPLVVSSHRRRGCRGYRSP